MKVDLSKYNNAWYKCGNKFKRLAWYFTNEIVFRSGVFPFYNLKVFLLRVFGARVGAGVLIKPHVNIKYPWFLQLGNHIWIGENVWIDNLGLLIIEDHVCISQGAFILSGSHDYTTVNFDLIVKPIHIEQGVWVGARVVIGGGAICRTHAVISAGSVVTGELESNGIYRGNPATKIRDRVINSQTKTNSK